MVYADTSIVVAYYCPEEISEKAEKFLQEQATPAISSLTEIEMFSAVSRKVREGGLDRKAAKRILAKFLEHLEGQLFKNLPVQSHHFRLARDWIGLLNTRVKSLDALHLAIASAEGLMLVTADRGLAESAKTLGVEYTILA
jgi:predicted nucleic acid-binding protein